MPPQILLFLVLYVGSAGPVFPVWLAGMPFWILHLFWYCICVVLPPHFMRCERRCPLGFCICLVRMHAVMALCFLLAGRVAYLDSAFVLKLPFVLKLRCWLIDIYRYFIYLFVYVCVGIAFRVFFQPKKEPCGP